MTATRAPEPEPILEAYADATRIVASAQLVRRFQAEVAQERARSRRRPWSGLAAWARGARARLAGPIEVAFVPQVAFALRLHGLTLLLLLVLALGALVGGAGAVLVRVTQGPDRAGPPPVSVMVAPHASARPGPSARPVPSATVASPLPLPAAVATASPGVSVRPLAQQAPRPHPTHPRSHGPARAAPGRSSGGWSRDRRCAW